MSERKKPSEHSLVASTEAGEILKATPPESEADRIRRERLEKWRSHTYEGKEILSKLTPREWLVKGWLPLDGTSSLYAPSGKGKSFYALALALEVARGGLWAGEPLEASPVLYVAAERPRDQRDRLEAWLQHYEADDAPNFALLEAAPQLNDELSVVDLCSYIRERGARLVVLDTFARMTLGLEENSSKDMSRVMEALDQIREATEGGSVLVVHHTGKDTAKGARGSTAFLAALDTGITLDGDAKALRARVDKSNAGPEPLPEWYKLEEVWLPGITPAGPKRGSAVLVPTLARQAGSDLDAVVLEMLEEAGPLSRAQLRVALGEDQGKEPSDRTVSRALKRLEEAGSVSSSGGSRPTYAKSSLYPPRP